MPKKMTRWVDRQFQIYALVDPRDKMKRDVGMGDDVQFRYHEHVSRPRNRQEKAGLKSYKGLA